MVEIKAMHIHCRGPENAAGKRKTFIKVIKLSDPTNKLAIQHDVGEAVQKLRNTGKYEYYYVIAEIERKGKPAYRPVIPKTEF